MFSGIMTEQSRSGVNRNWVVADTVEATVDNVEAVVDTVQVFEDTVEAFDDIVGAFVDTAEAFVDTVEAISVISQDTELAESICCWSSLEVDCRLKLWR